MTFWRGILPVAFACMTYAQQSAGRLGASTNSPETAVSAQVGEAAKVLKLEKSIAAAIARGDAAYFDSVTASDFVMTHSDRWTTGGKPLLVDDKKSFMKRVENHDYLAHDIDSAKIEMHGDVAITYGHYIGHMQHVPPDRAWFSIWYEKIYVKRNGQWQYLSHRTVHGATYGLNRESLIGN
jgi:hypothetical protein